MSGVTAGDTRSLRLFVAIQLPAQVRGALQRAVDALKQAGAGGALRWVRPEGIHLTLKFLGATPAPAIPAINTALRVAVRETPPLRLQPEGVGSFGGRRNLRVVWVGLTGDTEGIVALARRVDAALERLHIPPETRGLNPHLTLARVREGTPPDEHARIHELLAAAEAPSFPAFDVTEVSLMQSKLQRGGAVYQQLASFSLEGTP